MEKVICPSCQETFNESEWNDNTKLIVNSLNNNSCDIIPYSLRTEGMLYRCPNNVCQDEVVSDFNGVLRTQDDNGNPIII